MGAPTLGQTPYVLIRLRGREFAVAIGDVVEVLRMAAVRPLPEAPPWIIGVLNLRGRGVPIMDLSRRFNMEARPIDPEMAIVVVRVDRHEVGLIVDEVLDVVDLDPERTDLGGNVLGVAPIFSALAHAGDRSILVLDLPRIVAASEIPHP